MTNFVQDGKTMPHTPGSDVLGGAVIVIGEKVTVAKVDIPANTLGAVATTGTFDWKKDETTAFAVGVKIFWDEADQEATEAEDTGTNKLIGYTTVAALAADVNVRGYLANDIS